MSADACPGMVPRSLVVALVSIFSALALAVPAQAIVGGQVSGGSTATSYPWQVAITTTMDNEDWFCGGTRVAPDLVLTAAHCVIDDDGRIAVPSHVTVFSGSTVLSNTTFSRATAVALFPGLDLQATPNGTPSGDLALVRIPSSAPGSPVSVIDASESALWDVGSQLRITGWGYTSTNPANTAGYDVQRTLNWANVNRLSDDVCASAYGADFVGATMFCARGTTGADTCLGDSGGPIAYRMGTAGQLDNPSVWRLVGVTSWGTGCGDASFPGVYARLGEPALRAFATDADPVWSPVNVTAPTMPSSATVGDVVTCAPGTWTGDDLVFSYEFHRRQADGSTVVVQSSASNTYTVAAGDTTGLSCVQLARNAGGTAWASSGSTPVTPADGPAHADPVARDPARARAARDDAADRLLGPGEHDRRRLAADLPRGRALREPALHGVPARHRSRALLRRPPGHRHGHVEAELPQARPPHDLREDRARDRPEGQRHDVDAAPPAPAARLGVGRGHRGRRVGPDRHGPEADLQGSLSTLIVPNAGSLAPCRRAPLATSSRR